MQIAIRAALAALLMLSSARAPAQQDAPPPPSPPATTAPTPAPPAPPGTPGTPGATPGAATAPAPAAPSTLAPEPAPAGPALSLEPRTTPGDAEGRPEPFYQKLWFWGAVALVLTTAAVVLVTSAGSAGPATPNTTLGNMNAY